MESWLEKLIIYLKEAHKKFEVIHFCKILADAKKICEKIKTILQKFPRKL